MTTGYTYETFPGQTIVRTAPDDAGYPWDDLLAELRQSGDGIVLADEDRTDDRIEAIVGRECHSL